MQGLYPAIESASPLQVSDHRRSNEIETTERYSGDAEEADALSWIQLYGLNRYLQAPADSQTQHPFPVAHPVRTLHRVRFKSADDSHIEPFERVEDNDYFRAELRAFADNGEYVADVSYASKVDRVEIASLDAYREAVERVNDWLSVPIKRDVAIVLDHPWDVRMAVGALPLASLALFCVLAWRAPRREGSRALWLRPGYALTHLQEGGAFLIAISLPALAFVLLELVPDDERDLQQILRNGPGSLVMALFLVALGSVPATAIQAVMLRAGGWMLGGRAPLSRLWTSIGHAQWPTIVASLPLLLLPLIFGWELYRPEKVVGLVPTVVLIGCGVGLMASALVTLLVLSAGVAHVQGWTKRRAMLSILLPPFMLIALILVVMLASGKSLI